jgi:hypothetical protein
VGDEEIEEAADLRGDHGCDVGDVVRVDPL